VNKVFINIFDLILFLEEFIKFITWECKKDYF